MPFSYTSTLLSALPWLEYAFQPAGMPPPQACIVNKECHSTTILLDSEALPNGSKEADGLIATGRAPVGVYTADCLPILIADSNREQVAALHSGLKGSLNGILIKAIRQLCERGATPSSLSVVVGPAIGPCCYELSRDYLSDLLQENPNDLRQLFSFSTCQPANPLAIRAQAASVTRGVWFDLPLLAKHIAMREGVPERQIELSGLCTYCMAGEEASYRRDRQLHQSHMQRYSWIKRR